MSYETASTSTIKAVKPINIFYVWYSELCRRLCSTPSPVVKPAKQKYQTVLDFAADRLKVEEWHPLISALRHDTSLHVIVIKSRLGNYQFMHEIDTEDKMRQMKRRTGSIWTAFILKSLLKSLSCTIRNTQVLTCLEFDGLPMFEQYLESLMKALQKNNTLKALSLSRCKISDPGCKIVCAYVRFIPNIEVLNLSGCGLTWESGEHIAKLIKYQQINRYCESWHNSLRYSDPNIQVMRGIKRITLNGNPTFGDCGLGHILNELEDDLWIKALDMQKCGLTENISSQVIDVIQYSQSLEIVDFRLNDQMSISTLEKILNLLKQKQLNYHPEYQWCNTTFSLTCESIIDSMSNFSTARNHPALHKVKSAPVTRQTRSKATVNVAPIRKTRTSECVSAMKPMTERLSNMNEERLLELNKVLLEELAKRNVSTTTTEIKKVTVKPKPNKQKNGIIIPELNLGPSTSPPLNKKSNGYKNGFFTGIIKNGITRSQTSESEAASTIFERIINNNSAGDQSTDDDDDNDSLLDYVKQEQSRKNGDGDADELRNITDNMMTSSQISLVKLMENLKKNDVVSCPMKTNKDRPIHSKYYITSNKPVKK